ncbi:hypothetical protein PFMC_05934, partial [Plasmodium falciparum CAMP/Malaysia]
VTFIQPDFQTVPQLNEVEFITRVSINDFDKFLEEEKITEISKSVYNNFRDKVKKSNLDEFYKTLSS